MKTFLKLVARDLYHRTQGDLAHTAVVFPNKRAGLFFNEYLAEEAGRPIWSPAYLSISELFRSLSRWEIGDPVKLICELYRVFVQETQSRETLDDFYFWGEMLLGDFDDADKNCVNTDLMFSNLKDLRQLADDYTFIDPEQEEAIRQFFRNFSIERRTTLKERFISLWNVLGNIYKVYKERLASQGIAYEGMLYRDVIEQLNISDLPYDTYVFVGFNVLNQVEHTLFTRLKDAGKALFYWDYDAFYMDKKHHEAGEFIKRNLKDFPSSLPAEWFNTLSCPKEVTYVASPTENAQVRYLPVWIREHLTEKEKETAIVLCNEALLQPVLHSLPNEVRHANITMGFPLSQTPVYSFLSALLDLHIHGYNAGTGRYAFQHVDTLLRHPYTRLLTSHAECLEKELKQNNRFYPLPSELKRDGFLSLLFTPVYGNLPLCDLMADALQQVAGIYRSETQETDADNTFNQLYRESLFKAYTTVNRFRSLIEEGDMEIQPDTFRRLLVKVLSTTSIPFHGEPAVGMQIMGVLETRNLDFRHLAMLSVNEGQLPKASGDASFIPYNLRKAFGMTTLEHKIAVYAYYFYRLLQRAEKITLFYNTGTDGLNRGEWSRFMLQFLLEWKHPILRRQLETNQSPQETQTITVPKTKAVMQRMHRFYDLAFNSNACFSPSALNTYLDCPLKFYYKYVANLSAPDRVNADIDSATFGSIFHRAAEQIYKDLTTHGNEIDKETLDRLVHNDVKLQTYVDNAFKELFFHVGEEVCPEYNGVQLVNSAVITRYVKQLLQNDWRYAPFTFVASEKKVSETVEIMVPGGHTLQTRIGGIIDRMDTKNGTMRIVDYKTGGDAETPSNIAAVFTPDKKRPGHVFQTFLYASIVCRQQTQHIAPALLYIHRAASENYSPVIQIGEPRKPKEAIEDFSRYADEFRQHLRKLLEEIFHPDIPFTQTELTEKCAYCDYKDLCKR